MSKLWVDTDVGVDPDDFFAIDLLSRLGLVDRISVSFQNLDSKLCLVDYFLKQSSIDDKVELVRGKEPKVKKGQTPGFITEKPLLDGVGLKVDNSIECKTYQEFEDLDEFELCCLGPQTTVAEMLDKSKPTRIVVMGGSVRPKKDIHEYNARSDVTAFRRVMNSDVPVYCFPEEEYLRAPFSPEEVGKIVSKSKVGRLLEKNVELFQDFMEGRFGADKNKIWMADLLTVFYLVKPELYTTTEGTFDIEDSGKCAFVKGDYGNFLIELKDPREIKKQILDVYTS